jgi:hypothetical protein
VFAILGSSSLVVLRPAASNKYYVIGVCYVRGLVDDESYLGPLPSLWKVQFRKGTSQLFTRGFLDTLSGQTSSEDPRMGQLPSDWEKVEGAIGSSALPEFKNKITGEIVNADPRLFPEHLKKRGINVQLVHLV